MSHKLLHNAVSEEFDPAIVTFVLTSFHFVLYQQFLPRSIVFFDNLTIVSEHSKRQMLTLAGDWIINYSINRVYTVRVYYRSNAQKNALVVTTI